MRVSDATAALRISSSPECGRVRDKATMSHGKPENTGQRPIDDGGAAAETHYLVRRWHVTASNRGFVWIRPIADIITPEEVAGFLVMFRRCCDSGFPAAIVFDLHRSRVAGEQWSLLCDLLADFAGQLGARCRFISAAGRPVSSAVLTRRVQADRAAAAMRVDASGCSRTGQ